jgi:hypothetical protein
MMPKSSATTQLQSTIRNDALRFVVFCIAGTLCVISFYYLSYFRLHVDFYPYGFEFGTDFIVEAASELLIFIMAAELFWLRELKGNWFKFVLIVAGAMTIYWLATSLYLLVSPTASIDQRFKGPINPTFMDSFIALGRFYGLTWIALCLLGAILGLGYRHLWGPVERTVESMTLGRCFSLFLLFMLPFVGLVVVLFFEQLGGLSHDFRDPLGVLGPFLDWLFHIPRFVSAMFILIAILSRYRDYTFAALSAVLVPSVAITYSAIKTFSGNGYESRGLWGIYDPQNLAIFIISLVFSLIWLILFGRRYWKPI